MMQSSGTSRAQAAPVMAQAAGRLPQLVIAAPRPEDAEAATALLQSAGLPLAEALTIAENAENAENAEEWTAVLVPQSRLGDLGDTGAWLRRHALSHLVLIVPEPVLFVAKALNAGIPPSDALREWSALASQGLTLVRGSGRRRSSVFFAEAVRAQPMNFVRKLGERLQLPLVSSGSDAEQDPKELPGAICRITAQNAIWQSYEARAQVVELTALAVPLGANLVDIVPPVDDVFEEYQKINAEAAEGQRRLNGEKAALEKGLEAAGAELDAARAKVETAQGELKAKQARAAHEKQDSADLERLNKDLQEENDLLLQQLHYVQEELESYYLASTEAGPELTEAKATIVALVNSLSWRITRPLRVVLGALTGKKASL